MYNVTLLTNTKACPCINGSINFVTSQINDDLEFIVLENYVSFSLGKLYISELEQFSPFYCVAYDDLHWLP